MPAPTEAIALAASAHRYETSGDIERARECHEQLCFLAGMSGEHMVEAYTGHAKFLARIGDPENGFLQLGCLDTELDDHPEVLSARIALFDAQDDTDSARADWQKLIRVAPTARYAANYGSWLCLTAKDYDESVLMHEYAEAILLEKGLIDFTQDDASLLRMIHSSMEVTLHYRMKAATAGNDQTAIDLVLADTSELGARQRDLKTLLDARVETQLALDYHGTDAAISRLQRAYAETESPLACEVVGDFVAAHWRTSTIAPHPDAAAAYFEEGAERGNPRLWIKAAAAWTEHETVLRGNSRHPDNFHGPVDQLAHAIQAHLKRPHPPGPVSAQPGSTAAHAATDAELAAAHADSAALQARLTPFTLPERERGLSAALDQLDGTITLEHMARLSSSDLEARGLNKRSRFIARRALIRNGVDVTDGVPPLDQISRALHLEEDGFSSSTTPAATTVESAKTHTSRVTPHDILAETLDPDDTTFDNPDAIDPATDFGTAI